MSPHAVNSFVSDLVEMAKAVDELPAVKDSLTNATRENSALLERIQSLELRAIDRKAEIETLHSTIRSLEVARDDAELRFLEAEDHANRSVDTLRDMAISLGSVISTLDPRKPQPEPEAKPEPVYTADGWDHNPPPSADTGQSSGPQAEQGQSEPGPTAASTVDLSANTVTASEPVEHGAEPNGPYHSLRYIDVPGFISRLDWLAGGGTDEDYDWRESRHG